MPHSRAGLPHVTVVADRFTDVRAVDAEPGMIEVVSAKTGAVGSVRIRAVPARAADLDTHTRTWAPSPARSTTTQAGQEGA
ncbi:hypothetical protein [Streptomyces sp. NPDC058254]|uniref:hypothetical protein n=1 Tax=Streptomyces sp. NPDC058254 TaxID=3346406 RepID=UPI0036E5D38D